MTVETLEFANTHLGNGVTTTFATPFFLQDSDIVAVFINAAGDRSSMTLDVDYTLAGAASPDGGTLTVINTARIPNAPNGGGTLVVYTDIEPTQDADFPSSGSFDPDKAERALDKRAMIEQILLGRMTRSLRAPDDDLAGSMELPNESNRKGRVLYFDTTTGRPSLLTPQALVALGDGTNGIDPALTLVSREALGLKGDGTDDSIVLNQKMEEYSEAGGATFYLEPAEGGQFYFRYPVKVPSFITLVFVGPPVKLHKDARIRIEGDYAETPVTNKFRLLSDASAGSAYLFIDTSPQGGAALSTFFAVGDVVVVRGMSDGAGNSLQKGEHRITALDDGLRRLTVTPTLEFSYEVEYAAGDYEAAFDTVDRTYVTIATRAALTVDGVEGSNTVTVDAAHVGRLAVGDFVIVEDEKLSSDAVSGGSANRIRAEIRQIIDIHGDGTNVVTLNGRLVRAYETTYNARLVVLNPAIRASVQGATVEFTEAPDARVHTFEIVRGFGCSIVDCSVPNDDAFGSWGNAFRFFYSVECHMLDCDVRNPKVLTSGNGYGHTFYYSTGCTSTRARASGCRHAILFQGSTQCRALSPIIGDDRLSAIDFHGLGEAECEAVDPIVTGGSRNTPDATTRTALKFGNTAHRVGPFRCRVLGASVSQYKGTGSRAVMFEPGTEEGVVRQLQADDIQTLFYFSDNSGAATLVAKRCSIEEAVVNGCAGRLIDVHGGRNGSTTKTLEDFTLRDTRIYGASQMIQVRQVAGFKMLRVAVDEHTVDATEPYFCTAIDVTAFRAVGCYLEGLRAGFAMTTCPSFHISRCDFVDFSGGTIVLQDNDGNTNGRWRYNDAIGFTWSKSTPASASTGMTEFPLAISSTSDFLTVS